MSVKYQRGIVIAALLLLSSGLHAQAHDLVDEQGEGGVGSRYRIFTAEHEAVLRGGKVVKVRSIFKIDLQTGTVWRYRQGVDQKGKPFEEFFEVPNQ